MGFIKPLYRKGFAYIEEVLQSSCVGVGFNLSQVINFTFMVEEFSEKINTSQDVEERGLYMKAKEYFMYKVPKQGAFQSI